MAQPPADGKSGRPNSGVGVEDNGVVVVVKVRGYYSNSPLCVGGVIYVVYLLIVDIETY